MSTVTTPTTFASQLLSICSDALQFTEGGAIDRKFVSPGVPPFDCEMLVVIPAALTRYTRQGGALDAGHAHRTASLFLIGFQILIVRDCIPVTLHESTPEAPSPEQYEAAAAEIDQDVWAVWNALAEAAASGIFQGRCAEFFIDGAIALQTQGTFGGWGINIRAAIDGYVPAT